MSSSIRRSGKEDGRDWVADSNQLPLTEGWPPEPTVAPLNVGSGENSCCLSHQQCTAGYVWMLWRTLWGGGVVNICTNSFKIILLATILVLSLVPTPLIHRVICSLAHFKTPLLVFHKVTGSVCSLEKTSAKNPSLIILSLPFSHSFTLKWCLSEKAASSAPNSSNYTRAFPQDHIRTWCAEY